MLGDQAEKPKNPLKKAMKRRNAKKVEFAAPTYVEPSDVEYSTEEEDEADGNLYGQLQNGEILQGEDEDDHSNTVAPLKTRAGEIRQVDSGVGDQEGRNAVGLDQDGEEGPRTSDDGSDGKAEGVRSRNGTVRNTDSFFKDDSAETRKITLTPALVRDDSSVSTVRTSNESKEAKERSSLDKLAKESSIDKVGKEDKKKKDRKEKDKKPGMLSGLFKRKEKKSKIPEGDLEKGEIDEIILGKRSEENARSSPVPSKDSEDTPSLEEHASRPLGDQVQTQGGLSQKTSVDIPSTTAVATDEPGQGQVRQTPAPERAPLAAAAQVPSMRLVENDDSLPLETTISESSPKESKSSNVFSKMLRSTTDGEPKPEKAKRSKGRVTLDDFDSSPEPDDAVQDQQQQRFMRPSMPGGFPDSYIATPAAEDPPPQPQPQQHSTTERLSESPVHISPLHVSVPQSEPPALMVDNSSQEDRSTSVDSPSPDYTPSRDGEMRSGKKNSEHTPTPTPTWNDAQLRTFFDDDADIRDLLVVVYDKTDVKPAGSDHPVIGGLFKDENAKLKDITTVGGLSLIPSPSFVHGSVRLGHARNEITRSCLALCVAG